MTRTSKIVAAPPNAVYAAFMDPDRLLAWLPPKPMTGRLHEFEARVDGGYSMTLTYPEDEHRHRGKATEREDRVHVRFVELVPARRIVEAVTFETDDPALRGEMTIVVTFEDASGGTRVTFEATNLPTGLKAEDHEAGTKISLDQLALLLRTATEPS